mgnify:CR=1 FL=1
MIRKRTSILISAAVALLIGAAMLIRFMTKAGHGFPAAGVVRSLIYIGLITAWVFECCIHCGLIQSNMGCDVLFEANTIRAHITDRALRIKHSSADALPLSQEYMKQAVNGALRLDADTLLKCSPTRSGYIF